MVHRTQHARSEMKILSVRTPHSKFMRAARAREAEKIVRVRARGARAREKKVRASPLCLEDM